MLAAHHGLGFASLGLGVALLGVTGLLVLSEFLGGKYTHHQNDGQNNNDPE